MSLPAGFVFSQGSLQDYVDCPRRFQLRYLLHIAWPTPQAKPIAEAERHLRLGADFHRLVYQHAVGLPEKILSAGITDPDLRAWWNAYLDLPPAGLPPIRYPEISLSAPLAGYRLVAKYDLVAVSPGERLVVVDWKTVLHRPPRAWLERRLQTRVYRYLLVSAGWSLNRGEIVQPQTAEMIYWFANYPAQPERFRYDAAAYEADARYLATLGEEIAARAIGNVLEMTEDTHRCRYCRYFSLCERGIGPGRWEETEEEFQEELSDFDLSLEQVSEVEF